MMSAAAPETAHPVRLFDRSARFRMQFSGPKASESLTGLVTNDVLALRGGDGLYACALTTKGRVIADVRILATAGADGPVESLLVDTNAAAGVGFGAMIRKYMNPRLAKYSDATDATSCITLVGAGTASLLRRVSGDGSLIEEVASGAAFTHRRIRIGDTGLTLVRAPDLGVPDAFDLHMDRAASGALIARLSAAGAESSSDHDWHRLRVYAGRPEWGPDMDESTLAQEANMDALQAISYRKGCYTGQETVARVHFRGHVNRTLRRVRYGDAVPPDIGTPILSADASPVGDTRSSAVTDAGELIGIAMLRREIGDGAVLTWTSADAAVHPLTVVGAPDAG